MLGLKLQKLKLFTSRKNKQKKTTNFCCQIQVPISNQCVTIYGLCYIPFINPELCVTRSFHLITFSSHEDPIRPFTLLTISVFHWMCRIDSQPKPHWFPSWNKASLRPNLNLPVWLSKRGVHDGATVMIRPRFTCQHHFLATVLFFFFFLTSSPCDAAAPKADGGRKLLSPGKAV